MLADLAVLVPIEESVRGPAVDHRTLEAFDDLAVYPHFVQLDLVVSIARHPRELYLAQVVALVLATDGKATPRLRQADGEHLAVHMSGIGEEVVQPA